MKQREVQVIYKNRGSLIEIIGKVYERRPEEETSGIYEITCKDCEMRYYGQTKRRVETRIKEHDRACRNKMISKSAVAEHCATKGHSMGPYKLVKKVDNFIDLDAWESLYINKSKEDELMNTGEPPIKSILFDFAHVK